MNNTKKYYENLLFGSTKLRYTIKKGPLQVKSNGFIVYSSNSFRSRELNIKIFQFQLSTKMGGNGLDGIPGLFE